MWHLHAGRPERCLGGSESRDEMVARHRETGTGVLCESILSPEECARKLAEAAKARSEAMGATA